MTRKYDLPKYVCYNAASSRNLGRNDFEACLRINGKSLKRHFTNVKDATVYIAKLMLDNSDLYSFEEISDYLKTYKPEMENGNFIPSDTPKSPSVLEREKKKNINILKKEIEEKLKSSLDFAALNGINIKINLD